MRCVQEDMAHVATSHHAVAVSLPAKTYPGLQIKSVSYLTQESSGRFVKKGGNDTSLLPIEQQQDGSAYPPHGQR